MGLTARGAKRGLDLAVSVVGLCCLAPALPFIALAIRCEDGGPVLRRDLLVGVQRRRRSGPQAGRRVQDMRGRLFRGLRFRVLGERVRPVGRRPGEDPRLTRVGRLLRRSGLEEWPQLWNVLRGHMSLVGPRAVRPEVADRLGGECPAYGARLRDLEPGLFGFAQADGPADDSYLGVVCEKVVFDLHYRERLAMARPVQLVLADLDLVLSSLVRRWTGRERGRGNDLIRIDYPRRLQQVRLDPAHLARRTPADLGSEVLDDGDELTAWWYPPRRRPFSLPSRHDGLVDALCDAVEVEEHDQARYRKDLRPGRATGDDLLTIDMPAALQDGHRLCAHLEPLWQALAPRSDDEHFVFSMSFLVIEGLARVAGAAREGERLQLTVQIGRHAVSLCFGVIGRVGAAVEPRQLVEA